MNDTLVMKKRKHHEIHIHMDDGDHVSGGSLFRDLAASGSKPLTAEKPDDTIERITVTMVDRAGNTSSKEITRPKRNKNGLSLDARYLNLGAYLITPLILGVILGLAADTYLHTKPVFTLICIVLGTVATCYNLFKFIKNA